MIVVDTNVVSELMRPAPSPVVTSWVRARSALELYTTSITVGEINYGIERLPDGQRKDVMRMSATELFSGFAEHILAFDAVAAAEYGGIVVRREQAGAPINGFDAQIAAICRSHEALLASRNVRDFENTGVQVVDPWESGGEGLSRPRRRV